MFNFKLCRISDDGVTRIFNGENMHNLRDTVEDITPPEELLVIAEMWYQKSLRTGDIGSCVLGAGLEFKYKKKDYWMYPQSPWQGEASWTRHIDEIKEKLSNIGANNIKWHYGILD